MVAFVIVLVKIKPKKGITIKRCTVLVFGPNGKGKLF